MALERNRLRVLCALLVAPLVGLGTAERASAGSTTKKKTKKKATKKTATKKTATKKTAKKKTATKKKTTKSSTAISEPGMVALAGAGALAVAASRKLGRRKKKSA